MEGSSMTFAPELEAVVSGEVKMLLAAPQRHYAS
jgi:hypothetical protein